MKRVLAVLLLLLAAGLAQAQQQLEIIRLQHRSAEQVLPQLRPFLEPGGTLSGMNNQLFLRASAGNRQQILQVLSAIDRPARRLLITVRQDSELGGLAQGAEVSGSIGSGRVRVERRPSGSGGATVEIRRGDDLVRGRIYESTTSGTGRVSQQVQVVEGGKAFIEVGQSLPVPLRQAVLTPGGAVVSESIVYRDIGTGFYAEPHLAGDTVELTISPTHDTPANLGPGSANIQRISTTVSARLGEWMQIGGMNQDTAEDQSGTLRYSTRGSQGARRVMLKVEEVP